MIFMTPPRRKAQYVSRKIDITADKTALHTAENGLGLSAAFRLKNDPR